MKYLTFYSLLSIAFALLQTVPALLDSQEPYRLNNALGNEATNHASAADNPQNVKQEAIKAYAAVLMQLLALSSNPVVAVGGAVIVDHFTSVISKIVADKQHDIWTDLEERVDTRIDNKITHNHFGVMVTHVKKLQGYMRDNVQLTAKDLHVHILPLKYQFLPQTFAYTSFNSKWTTALPAYMTYMTAAYLELISKGQVGNCELAKQLQTIRAETIQAAKALFRARYRALDGVEYEQGWPPYSCKGIFCYQVAWFTYKDGTTGVTHKNIIGNVQNSIISNIQRETADLIWKQMVEKVNVFFNKDVCLCECPKPITKSEVKFSYPHECYGNGNDNFPGSWCRLPCHSYGYGYMWCPVNRFRHNNLLGDWDYCDKDQDMIKCMPVKGTTIFDKTEA